MEVNKADRKPHLFTPPTKGTQTVVRSGTFQRWIVNTFDGSKWWVSSPIELSEIELTKAKQFEISCI
jgi:hypothetical protein